MRKTNWVSDMEGRETVEIVTLDTEAIELSLQFGEKVVDGYVAGRKEASKGYRVPGKPSIWDDPFVQAQGRMCEIGCCLWLGLDYRSVLDWGTQHCDPLVDFTHNGQTVDVKGSGHERAKYLIWPVTKLEFMKDMADRLILARTGNDRLRNKVEIVGWITKERFLLHHKTADSSMPLVKGTPYMVSSSLLPPREWN